MVNDMVKRADAPTSALPLFFCLHLSYAHVYVSTEHYLVGLFIRCPPYSLGYLVGPELNGPCTVWPGEEATSLRGLDGV